MQIYTKQPINLARLIIYNLNIEIIIIKVWLANELLQEDSLYISHS